MRSRATNLIISTLIACSATVGCVDGSYIVRKSLGIETPVTPVTPPPAGPQKTWLFGVSQAAAKELVCFEFNNTDGSYVFKNKIAVADIGNHVVTHPTLPFVFTISWTNPVERVHGFKIGSNCELTPVPNSPIDLAIASYHESISMHPSGKFVYIAEDDAYIEGVAIDQTTGALSIVPGNPTNVGASTWPMHVAFYGPDSRYLVSANQGTNTLSSFSVNLTTGELSAIAGSPFNGTSGAYWVLTHGDHIISVDREIAAGWTSFLIDQPTGQLSAPTFIGGGSGALQSGITSNGKVILSADNWSEKVEVVQRNPTTGALSRPTPANYATGNGTSGLIISPQDKFVIVSDAGTAKNLYVYSIDTTAATLTLVSMNSMGAFSINGLAIGVYSY